MRITALYKALLEANVSETSAEKAVEGLISAGEAATKADMAKVETGLKGTATKADLAKLEAKLEMALAELKADMLRWNIIIAGVIIAAMGLIVRL